MVAARSHGRLTKRSHKFVRACVRACMHAYVVLYYFLLKSILLFFEMRGRVCVCGAESLILLGED
jgi:hypothetical protein